MPNRTHGNESDPSPQYPLSRAAPTSLVDVAAEIEHADTMLGSVTSGKLHVIVEQIRTLQQQAKQVLERAQRDSTLHRVSCPFKKRPGHVYHLYRKDCGEQYFSMLSPQDWKGKPPHNYEGAWRLEPDMSWTCETDEPERAEDEALVHRLLSAQSAAE